jgi:formate hydrogenlyase subunit 3/multisubunit Na+/H+ antiporter MnhD subunit
MQDGFLIFLVLIPISAGLLNLGMPRRLKGFFALLVSLVAVAVSFVIFAKESTFKFPGIGFGIDFSFKLYHFNSFIIAAISVFTFLTAFYCASFFNNKNNSRQFYTYLLLTLGMSNGAVLADNLVVMLFFWEGLLLTLFGMIADGRGISAFKTATKAFIIVGITDLCLMIGIVLTGKIAGTLNMSEINLVPTGLAGVAFVLLVIGAISKAGSMPFHTWIPDAAIDAPLPFMAYIPAALEKLLGIYFLARICLNLFHLEASSGLSTLLMTVGAITILLAVMMALIQKDYKRLLSYHAISQVGYMILGIGTALPIGIVGGLFHMINNALYKSCLFFTAGAVEKQTGTTDLRKLGGLGAKMPVTSICFLITAISISGVPPFNGFFSKEMVYDAALKRGLIFYILALLGSFFTAASFLKLGHAVYLGKIGEQNKETKEAPFPMLAVMAVIAGCCILFGIFNYFPLKHFIQPALVERLGEHHFWGWPENWMLVLFSLIVLGAALIHHLIGVKLNGSGLKAADHIYNSILLHRVYLWQEKQYFDPYVIGLKLINGFARIFWLFDRLIDWIYDHFTVGIARGFSRILRWMHNGNYVTYIIWSLLGVGATIIFIVR